MDEKMESLWEERSKDVAGLKEKKKKDSWSWHKKAWLWRDKAGTTTGVPKGKSMDDTVAVFYQRAKARGIKAPNAPNSFADAWAAKGAKAVSRQHSVDGTMPVDDGETGEQPKSICKVMAPGCTPFGVARARQRGGSGAW